MIGALLAIGIVLLLFWAFVFMFVFFGNKHKYRVGWYQVVYFDNGTYATLYDWHTFRARSGDELGKMVDDYFTSNGIKPTSDGLEVERIG